MSALCTHPDGKFGTKPCKGCKSHQDMQPEKWTSRWNIALTVVTRKTMAVGRQAGIRQDGDLGQADAHNSQVAWKRDDGEEAP